jgi:hypothetical protein
MGDQQYADNDSLTEGVEWNAVSVFEWQYFPR